MLFTNPSFISPILLSVRKLLLKEFTYHKKVPSSVLECLNTFAPYSLSLLSSSPSTYILLNRGNLPLGMCHISLPYRYGDFESFTPFPYEDFHPYHLTLSPSDLSSLALTPSSLSFLSDESSSPSSIWVDDSLSFSPYVKDEYLSKLNTLLSSIDPNL